MTTIVWHLLTALIAMNATDDMLKPPPSQQQYDRFVKECKEGIHVSCLRDGIGWLTRHQLPLAQKRAILAQVANAHLSLRQDEAAAKAMMRVLRLAPCSAAPAGMSPQAAILFQQQQKILFKADVSPPILTHITPPTSKLRSDGKLQIKATDDLQIRDITLFYRMSSKGSYLEEQFVLVKGTTYQATIPVKLLQAATQLEYYIVARDCANRSSNNDASAEKPIKMIFVEKGSSAKAVGGGLLIAVGAGLFVGSSLALVTAGIDSDRLKNTRDPATKVELEQRVSVLQGLGWSGIILGAVAVGVGIFLLIPPRKPKSANPRTLDEADRTEQSSAFWLRLD